MPDYQRPPRSRGGLIADHLSCCILQMHAATPTQEASLPTLRPVGEEAPVERTDPRWATRPGSLASLRRNLSKALTLTDSAAMCSPRRLQVMFRRTQTSCVTVPGAACPSGRIAQRWSSSGCPLATAGGSAVVMAAMMAWKKLTMVQWAVSGAEAVKRTVD